MVSVCNIVLSYDYCGILICSLVIISECETCVFDDILVANEADSKEDELGKFIEEEEMSSGSVSLRVFWEFIMAALWATVLGTLLLFALGQAIRMTADYFLSDMVNCGMQIKAYELSNSTEVKFMYNLCLNYPVLTNVEHT
jgi:hypothetical protein